MVFQMMRERRRLRNLVRLATRYYLSYSNIEDTVDVIKNLVGQGNGVVVDYLTKAYVKLIISLASLTMLNHSINLALRDRLIYREFKIDQGNDPLGPLSIPHTIATYPMNVYSYITYVPSGKAPEYMVLRGIATMVINNIKSTRSELKRTIEPMTMVNQDNELVVELNRGLVKLNRIMRRVRQKVALLPKSGNRINVSEEYGRLVQNAPNWLKIAHESLLLTKYLHGEVYVTSHRRVRGNDALIMLSWRLYEILVYALVRAALRRMGYFRASQSLFLNPEVGDSVMLMFNKPLSVGIVERIDELIGEDNDRMIKSIVGKPDLYMKNKRSVVIECKFSTNLSYITAGRFKVMAYMYEHNADAGILVFPGLSEGMVFDDEDDATLRLYGILRRRGYVELRLKEGKVMYLLMIDPGERKDAGLVWDIGLRRISEVLRRIVGY